METAKKITILSLVGITALAMKINAVIAPDKVEVNLADALKAKSVTGNFESTGEYSGSCVHMNLKNTTNKQLTVHVPAGTLFKPADEGEQNIVVPEAEMFVLAPGQTKSGLIEGYCCEANDKAPSGKMAFTVASHSDPKMYKLFEAVKGKNYSNDVLQESIWCISNNHNVSNVYASNGEDVKVLRESICQITGQKDTWYSTPQNHVMDENRNISHETTQVTGLVKFKALAACKIHNEIYGADNKLILKNPNEFNVPKGNVEYDFEIKVKGWQKGTYFVKVFENNKVIHTQEFKI